MKTRRAIGENTKHRWSTSIHVVDRIIYPSQKRIDAMVKNLSGPMGQINAVLITKYSDSSWKVVAGATRVLAANHLGWKQIEATIISADNDLEYQLVEVAENLHRHDLSENERVKLKKAESDLLAKRRALFDELVASQPNLTTLKAKGGRGKKGGVADAARKAGIPQQTAQDRVKKPTVKAKPVGLPGPEPLELPLPDTAPEHITHQPEPVHQIETTDRGPDAPALKPCPMCNGTGNVEIDVTT
jgi:ParB-like nuclease domain